MADIIVARARSRLGFSRAGFMQEQFDTKSEMQIATLMPSIQEIDSAINQGNCHDDFANPLGFT